MSPVIQAQRVAAIVPMLASASYEALGRALSKLRRFAPLGFEAWPAALPALPVLAVAVGALK